MTSPSDHRELKLHIITGLRSSCPLHNVTETSAGKQNTGHGLDNEQMDCGRLQPLREGQDKRLGLVGFF